jgi:hypothetical protein
MYKIFQYSDDIEVYKDNKIYLKVTRKLNWLGKLTSVFKMNDAVVLESTYFMFPFRLFLSIKYQNLPKTLVLFKYRGSYILNIENKNLIFKDHSPCFKNPLYTVEDDSKIVAEISTKLCGLNDIPIFYKFVTTDNDDNFDLYYLIRFLIELAPTMTV